MTEDSTPMTGTAVITPEGTAFRAYLMGAKYREADRIAGAVEAFLAETADLPFEQRIDRGRRKVFLVGRFTHLFGIEKAMVECQASMKITTLLYAEERARLEASDD